MSNARREGEKKPNVNDRKLKAWKRCGRQQLSGLNQVPIQEALRAKVVGAPAEGNWCWRGRRVLDEIYQPMEWRSDSFFSARTPMEWPADDSDFVGSDCMICMALLIDRPVAITSCFHFPRITVSCPALMAARVMSIMQYVHTFLSTFRVSKQNVFVSHRCDNRRRHPRCRQT